MTEELDILKIIAENPEISQRKIAEQSGISLGQVNFLIKKCVKKGLVKLEGQTSKSIKYNLTTKGIAEKAALTLEYIKISYEAVSALANRIETLSTDYDKNDIKIYVYGANDEMMQMVKLALNGNHIPWSNWKNNGNSLEEVILSNNYIVLCWESIFKEELDKNHINVLNILE